MCVHLHEGIVVDRLCGTRGACWGAWILRTGVVFREKFVGLSCLGGPVHAEYVQVLVVEDMQVTKTYQHGTRRIVCILFSMAMFNHTLAFIIWVIVCVALASKSDSFVGAILFVPFTLGPHAVTHAMCFLLKSRRSATLLGIGMLGYVSWFFFVYIDVFYVHLDAQSSIALLFVGLVSLPVMIPVWLGAFAFEQRAKIHDEYRAAGR